jgi:spore coat protein U-like protein
VVALLIVAPAAQAITTCRVAAGSGLAFGSYDLLSTAPTDSQGSVTVQCDRNGGAASVSLVVRIDAGANAPSVQSRRMLRTGGGGGVLAYNLYRDAARSSIWGGADGVDTVGASLTVPDRGSASVQLTIYGRMPPRQNAAVGTYSDVLQLTILY